MITLDMRNKPCPMPVVSARKALNEAEQVLVMVDNEIAVQNLEKMANGEGHLMSWLDAGSGIYEVTISRSGAAAVSADSGAKGTASGLAVVIASECLGSGSDELGMRLMRGYLFALTELDQPPEHVIFMNGGAKLTTAGAPTVPDLERLLSRGTVVMTCGTCADYYGLRDSLAVGTLTDMMNIVTISSNAANVINL